MRENGRRGATRRCAKSPEKEKRASKSESAPGLAKRDFGADGPNKARFADIACVGARQGRLCLAAVDAWSRKVAGWSMAPGMAAGLADDALRMAMARRGPERGCLRRSGHGSRHASPPIGGAMEENGIVPSTGSVSSPWDNAVAESSTGPSRRSAHTFSGREEAALEVSEYVGCLYDRIGTRSALGRLSPEEFEKKQMEESRPKAA